MALVAPNGSGKSAEIAEAARGKLAAGRPLSEYLSGATASYAYVAQTLDCPAVSTRVSALLEVPLLLGGATPSQARTTAADALAHFDLGHLYDRTIESVSGGESQILHVLAGTVLKRPGVIVDDPFGMLDPIRRAQMLKLLIRIASDSQCSKGVVLAATDADELAVRQVVAKSGNGLCLAFDEPASRAGALDEVVRACSALARPPKIARPRICRDVGISVGKKRILFDGLSYQFMPGHMYVVTGPNGSGKSLFLHALCARLPRGASLAPGSSFDPSQRRAFAGAEVVFVPQHCRRLLTFTTPLDAMAVLRSVGQQPEAPAFPDCLGRHRPISEASVGETQFVTQCAAASSTVSRPQTGWLIADEPDAFLDQSLQGAVAQLFSVVAASGRGVIVASHRPALYRGAIEVPIPTTSALRP